MIDLGQVVIFRGQPEQRDGGLAGFAKLFGQAQRGQGLVDRVAGAGEQAHLLARYDRGSAARELVERRLDGGIGAKGAILRAKDAGHFGAKLAIYRCLAGDLEYRLQGGCMGEEVGQLRKIGDVSGIEMRGAGDLRRAETVTLHGLSHHTFCAGCKYSPHPHAGARRRQ